MDNAHADHEKFKQETEEEWIVDDIKIEIVKLEPYDERCLDEERLMPNQVQQGFTLSYADGASMCEDEIEIGEIKVQSLYESDEAEFASLAQYPLKLDCMNNINSDIAPINTSTGSVDLELPLAPRRTSDPNPLGQRAHLADQNGATLDVYLTSRNVVDSNPIDEAANNRSQRAQRIHHRAEKDIQLNDKCESRGNILLPKQQEETADTEEDGSHLRKQCPECGKTISAKHFKTHLTVHSTYALPRCEICNQSFKHKRTLVAHYVSHHPPSEDNRTKLRKQCPECGKYILCKFFKGHMMTHVQDGSKPCKICNKLFKRMENLYAHLRRMHDCKDICEECCEPFGNIALLRAHWRTHYRCVICNKACKSEVNLAIHNAIWHPRSFSTS